MRSAKPPVRLLPGMLVVLFSQGVETLGPMEVADFALDWAASQARADRAAQGEENPIDAGR